MESTDPGPFGRQLRELREAAALSQEELAERADLSAKAIGALERGERRRPYPNTIRALCRGLRLDETEARRLADAARPSAAGAEPPRVTPAAIPTAPTPMLGRATELARVSELLDVPTTRMVTLTGPGGVGKTRLASELARQLQAAGRDVVPVELADIRRVDLVVPTIARALGLTAGSEDFVGSIAALMADREAILVLDNFEHLLGAATEVAELVERCPTVVVLATSRAPLRVRAEHEVPIDPLRVPGPDDDLAAVDASPAAQMFADRARSVAPDFDVDASNAAAVAEICRRLDGLPLALELAAAHVRYLPPPQLLERLGHAVGSARLRDLPERQQTMTATLDWSNALLTGNEQAVLRSLSVFAGGFHLDAAEDVAGGPERDVLTALEGLVEQSLVLGPTATGRDGESRFRTLESVREYAARSIAADDAAALAARHAAYYARLGGAARTGLRSSDLPRWLDRLEVDHANLRAALGTLLDRGELGTAARLGADTWLYWALRGYVGEGLIWWQRVLDDHRGDGLDDAGTAAAHLALAGLRFASGDVAGARRDGESAAIAARSAADLEILVEALVLACMGAAFEGDLEVAAAHLAELSEVGAGEGDPWARAHVLIAHSQVAMLEGRTVDCATALDSAEELARGQAGQFTLGTVLNMRTTLALQADDDGAALRSATEAAELAAEVGTTWTLVYTLSALATLAARGGRFDLAAELFGFGAATADVSLVEVSFRPDLDSAASQLDEVRSRLSADEFELRWAHGRELDVDEVVQLIPAITARRARS